MPLTDEQDERLTLILDGLGAVRARLYPAAQRFVDDQVKRHGRYGQQIFLSPKQDRWLADLYREFVGTEPEAVGVSYAPRDEARRAAREDIEDFKVDEDEIPF